MVVLDRSFCTVPLNCILLLYSHMKKYVCLHHFKFLCATNEYCRVTTVLNMTKLFNFADIN